MTNYVSLHGVTGVAVRKEWSLLDGQLVQELEIKGERDSTFLTVFYSKAIKESPVVICNRSEWNGLQENGHGTGLRSNSECDARLGSGRNCEVAQEPVTGIPVPGD